uniref:Uncharacterized protein n=1 Tax=Chromera velia CCMP2878 TaxID=1169474 RepID=A0A0G4IAM8_9ALVE|mmetsp:Transcript_43412/g.85666  ORF Transcript_43412/g.85666 Transcript_43412/m.85666 type:complete len:287 (+) Transcript_43412:61-921(+)|eukprot:Cvel_2111.t1-p1 / transcript=Cvel_2111.t1 / gene=Cvel_2111 / organism=Chromera_velia_CCMP2878 / gene_product=hypothetical protein / transcript_product=hypothetical protein / location=Cvel_scaffold81:128824-129681(+) / protein_length=286 / sequence_SO=supercontig / SO=protein_coding / is_pseudo=false
MTRAVGFALAALGLVATCKAAKACLGKTPSFSAQCSTITDEKECNSQIACVWGEGQDERQWFESIANAVKACEIAPPAIPGSVSLSPISAVSMHDHQLASGPTALNDIVDAWGKKFVDFPTAEVAKKLHFVFDVESQDYRVFHDVITSPNSSADIIAIAGRNFGGTVSLAIIQAHASTQVTTYVPGLHCGYGGGICVGPASECCMDAGKGTYCPDGHGCYWCGRSATPVHYDCSKIPVSRGLLGEETAAIYATLQHSVKDKMQGELALMKNELLPETPASLKAFLA